MSYHDKIITDRSHKLKSIQISKKLSRVFDPVAHNLSKGKTTRQQHHKLLTRYPIQLKNHKMASTMTYQNSAFTTPSSSLIMSEVPSSPPAAPIPRRQYVSIPNAGFEGDRFLPHGLFIPQLDHFIDFNESRVPLLTLHRRRKSSDGVTGYDQKEQQPLTLRPRIPVTDSTLTQSDGDDQHHDPSTLTADSTATTMNDMDDDIPFLDPLWNTQRQGKAKTSCFSSLQFLPHSSGRRRSNSRRPSHPSIVLPVPERK